jgi:ADP-ribosylglycohydrolase
MQDVARVGACALTAHERRPKRSISIAPTAARARLRAQTTTMEPTNPGEDRVLGCLLGGAVGDALGAAVEFMPLREIRQHFGDDGLTDYAACYGRLGAITDDTQMTLFTAEGLMRAEARWQDRGICHPASVVHHAYQRWLLTQGRTSKLITSLQEGPSPWPDGWLIAEKELWSQRAPGNTCLAALEEAADVFGEPAQNDSKGCGTVMRVAPVGIIAAKPFDLGAQVSALTHGHPTGIVAGGYFAQVIALIFREDLSIEAAARKALADLEGRSDADEVRSAVQSALKLAEAGNPTPERLAKLGEGWVAEEAVSIALYAALVARDFREAVLIAVNHSGDSDSTGSLAGNLYGTSQGMTAIPATWLERLELRSVIEQIARDVYRLVDEQFRAERERERYPGW